MVASRSARERRARTEAGPLARVSITVGRDQQFVYKIGCTECTSRGGDRRDRPWSAYRPGGDNGYLAAMDRWIFHVLERHPDAEAPPCLTYLPEAQQRLQERRDGGD